jgi:hypothetical protein
MKPIRDYSDGQWLLLLWAFIVLFLIAGLAMSTLVLVVAIVAAIGAAYTTYLYARERIGRSPSGSLFGRPGGTSTTTVGGADQIDPTQDIAGPGTAPRDIENHEGGAQ